MSCEYRANMSEETDTDAQIVDFKIDWNPSAAAAPAASFEETAPKVEPTDAAVASPKKAAGKNFTAKKAKKEKKNSRGKKTSKKKKLSSPSAKKKSATAVAETLQHQRRLPLDRHAKDPKIVAALRAMLFEDESAMTASLKNETSSKVVWSTYVTLKIRNKAKNGPELAQLLLDGKFDAKKRLLEAAIMKNVDPTKVKIPTAEPKSETGGATSAAAGAKKSSPPKEKLSDEEKKLKRKAAKQAKRLQENAAKDPNLELAISEVVTRRMGIQAAAEKRGVNAETLEKSLRRLCIQAQVRSLNEYRRKFGIVVDSGPPPPEKKAKTSADGDEKKENPKSISPKKFSTSNKKSISHKASSLPASELQKLRLQKATRRVVISKQSIEKSCERYGVTPAMINVELRRLYTKYKVDSMHSLAKYLQQEPEPDADVEISSADAAATVAGTSAASKKPIAVGPPMVLPKDPEGTLKKIMSKIHKIELVQALEAIVYDGESTAEAAKTYNVTASELSRLSEHVANEFGLDSIAQLAKVFPVASNLTLGEIQPDRDPQDYLTGIKDPRLLRAVRMAAINRVDPQEAANKYGISVEALQIHFRKVNELATSPATGSPEWDRVPRKCQEWIRRLEEAGYGLQPELREKLLKKLAVG